ncbi:MAG: HD domain-containing protein [Pseudomonadota bacterium]
MPMPDLTVPNRQDCLRLLRRRQVLGNVVEHCLRVAEVAKTLSRGLIRAGGTIDLALVEAAALLHDIAKVESLKAKVDHALAGQRLLGSLGFAPAVGHIVRHHVRLPDPGAEDELLCRMECEIVNYSDKRCNGGCVVSLAERFDYIRGRYGHTEEIIGLINKLENHTLELECRLFVRLPFSPEDLEEYLEPCLTEDL